MPFFLLILPFYAAIGTYYLIQLIVNSILATTPINMNIQQQPSQNEEQECDNSTTCSSLCYSESQIRLKRDIKESINIIHSWINNTMPPLPKSASPKLMLIELLSEHRSTRLNVLLDVGSYSVANSLAVLIIASLDIPSSSPLTTLLTNALRVSDKRYVCNFVLMALSSNENNASLSTNNTTINKLTFPGNNEIVTQEKESYLIERIAVSTLEKINRLQAELWITFPPRRNTVTPTMSPTSSTDTSNSAKRISNVSTSSRTSSTWSSYTTATTTHDDNPECNKFSNFVDDLHERLNPLDANYNDVIKFKSDFIDIKSIIEYMLNHQRLLLDHHRSDQVDNAFKLLVNNCNQMEYRLVEFECRFVFAQLCEFVACCISETRNCFDKMAETGRSIGRHELNELENWVYINTHLVKSLSQAFKNSAIVDDDEFKPIYKAQLDKLTDGYHELNKQYKQVYSVWTRITDIKTSIQEGTEMLNNVSLNDSNLSKNYTKSLASIRYIQDQLFEIIYQDLQSLVNELVVGMENLANSNDAHLASYEKISNSMVYSVFQELVQFKNDMMGSVLILKKYESKQKLKQDIEKGTTWLQTYKARLLAFALVDCLWSPVTNPTIRRDGLVDFQYQYDQFILTLYNDICAYFPRYSGTMLSECYAKKNIVFNDDGLNYQQLGDKHLIEEYKWFQDFQGLCDEVNGVLKFACQIQQQQADILKFIQHVKQHKGDQQQAQTIYKNEFEAIQWPTALEYGPVGLQFYNYSRSLYIEVSKIKIDFITACQQQNYYHV